MAEQLSLLTEYYDKLSKIRKYLVKKGKGRYKGNIIHNKTLEVNEIILRCTEIFNYLTGKELKPELIGLVSKIRDDIEAIHQNIIELCTIKNTGEESDSSENSSQSDKEDLVIKMEFDIKTACNLIPVMDGSEEITKRLIDAVEMYSEMLKLTEHSLLIKFVLKSRLTENAKLRMSQTYDTVSALITDLRTTLLTKKSFTALQSKLQTTTQGWRTIDQYGTEIEKLFTDLTISQADGNPANYQVIKPLNEKMAIKRFSDGLRDPRLSTIIAARNYDSLKNAIQAARDEECTSAAMANAGIMHLSRRGRGNVRQINFSSHTSNHYHRQRGNSQPTRGRMSFRGRDNYYQNNFRGRSSFGSTNRGRGSFSRDSMNGSRVFHRRTNGRGHRPMFYAQQSDQVTNPNDIPGSTTNGDSNQFFRV